MMEGSEMPKNARYTLVWSASRQAYELVEQQGGVQDVVPENADWLAQVKQLSSFSFHGRHGYYTACKEYKRRGEGYWYAYVRIGGKLVKRYLGRSASLTIPRLEQMAQELWSDGSDMLLQEEETGVSQFLAPANGQEEVVYCAFIPNYSNKLQVDHAAVQQIEPALVNLMGDPLLATKIHFPRPRSHLMHRPRLTQRLQQGMRRALALISAPVGFGKSTLLSDWLTAGSIPVAWLSLDPQDNEPVRFLSYLLAAVQAYDPHLMSGVQVLHDRLQPLSMESVLTLLINDLLLRGDIQEHFVVVLDNYHFITNLSIHHALAFLLDHLPPGVHVVLATREDPPLPLAQLRARGDLLELRATDLRFTPEEAHTFLTEAMGLSLTKEESTLLQVRTEGWITGLQLAAFSLQGRDDVGAFIKEFSGSNHYVVDYLLEEVLKRQSEMVQNFLLQTCILDRLCAPLCDAVREQPGSEILLDFLERANLFLVPLDNERKWYRYHRLLAEALRQFLQQIAPALVPVLHQRASRWYERQGLFAEAISHASLAHAPHSPHSVSMLESLTEREREVLRLLLEGASNQEIAGQLFLSVNTVKKHVLNICGKFNVRSRAQVIAKARTLPLL
jgi:LuxR family transcriptional regulator, maltose regulon positive regulatory protein